MQTDVHTCFLQRVSMAACVSFPHTKSFRHHRVAVSPVAGTESTTSKTSINKNNTEREEAGIHGLVRIDAQTTRAKSMPFA